MSRDLKVASRRIAAAAALLVFSVAAQATDYQKEYEKKIKAYQEVGVLGSDLAGDRVNFYTGSVSFAATDISLPTNAFSLSLGRSYSLEIEHNLAQIKGNVAAGQPVVDQVRQRLFGDWDLDVPHISATMTQSGGWVVDTPTPNSRCSVVGKTNAAGTLPATGLPPLAIGTKSSQWDPGTYFSGYTLHTPGGDQSMLLASASNTQRPSTGGPYNWTTNQDWWVSCLPSLAGPNVPSTGIPAGEGYLAIAPDGTRYTFNWLSKRNVTVTTDAYQTDPMGGGATRSFYLFRAEYQMLPTRIEDRFGNWIQYNWSADAYSRLLSVSAGPAGSTTPTQTITLTYNAQGFIATASDGVRPAWQYTYSSGSLTQVTQPDGSSWTYSLGSLNGLIPASPYCEGDWTTPAWHWLCFGGGSLVPAPVNAYIIHPSGARVDFTFDYHFQWSSSGDLFPIGLTQKTISGAGLTPATWKYSYLPSKDEIRDQCQAGACPTRLMTDQANPDGSLVRRIYGITPNVDESQQLGELQGSLAPNSGGSPAITNSARWGTDILDDVAPASGTVPSFYRELDYRYVPAGQAVGYLEKVGTNPLASAGMSQAQTWSSERRLPLQKQIQTQQAVTFTRETTAFDAYAHPTTVVRSNVGSAGGDASKTEVTTYNNNTSKWVIGQVESSTVAGKMLSHTVYDAVTAMPLQVFGVDPVNPEQTLTYNTDGTVATAKDALNHTVTLTQWSRGIPKQIALPDGRSMSADVSAIGQINYTIDQTGAKTCYGFDGTIGRMTSITYTSEATLGVCDESTWSKTNRSFAFTATTEYGLAGTHWKQTVWVGNGRTTTYYNAQWQPVLTITEDTGNAATRSFVVSRYDSLGRKTFNSYPVGSLTSVNDTLLGTTTEYDSLGRAFRVKQDSELGVLTSTTDYITGFQTRSTNARGYQSTTSYRVYDSPSTDLPTSISLPEGVTTTIARQAGLDKPLSVTRSGTYGGTLSATRSYVYDSNERLCKTVNPESGAALVEYDIAGNISWSADGSALTSLVCDRASVAAADKTSRTYDNLNRLLTVVTPGGTANTTTTYYADGAVNTITAANPGGNNVVNAYTYNKRRLLIGESSTNGSTLYTLGYGYNANGHVSSTTYPDGQVVGYAPDALGRATQVAVPAGQVYASGILYWPTGAIKEFSYGNGIKHTMTPNARQLPGQSIDRYTPVTGPVVDYLNDAVAYDPNSNVTALTDAAGTGSNNRTRSSTYDGLDRMLTANAPNQWGTAGYSYDPLDNLRTATVVNPVGTTTRSHFFNYTPDNRLLSISGPTGHGAYGFTYDSRGNTTLKNVGTTNCNTYAVLDCVGKVPQTFVFDSANRLSQVTGVQTYRYDGLGRRVQTTDADGKTTFWIYSQAGQVLHSSEARRSRNISYIYLGNTQVATRTVAWGTGAVDIRYQHTDGLGTPVIETDGNRTVTDRNNYTAWGEPWGSTTTDGTGYTGHVMDQGTGLIYMQQRYYDPVVGRFLGIDPIESEFNNYNYASNNPWRYIDPDGRQAAGAAKPATATTEPPPPPPEPKPCNAECKRKKSEAAARKRNTDESLAPNAATTVGTVVEGFGEFLGTFKSGFETSWSEIRNNDIDWERELSAIPGEGTFVRMGPSLGFGIRSLFLAKVAANSGRVLFSTEHYAKRLTNAGLDVRRVEKLVKALAESNRGRLVVDGWAGARTTIDGVLLQYNMQLQSTGTIFVSTIYPVLPKAP